jgi:hypothetical protein
LVDQLVDHRADYLDLVVRLARVALLAVQLAFRCSAAVRLAADFYPAYRAAPVAEDYVVVAVEDYAAEAALSAVAVPAWEEEWIQISWVAAVEDSSSYPCRLVVAQIPAPAWPKAEAAMATSQSLS